MFEEIPQPGLIVILPIVVITATSRMRFACVSLEGTCPYPSPPLNFRKANSPKSRRGWLSFFTRH